MPTFEDKQLNTFQNTDDEKRDFQIAWLNRRVENLEAVVFELLRDRVNFDLVDGYQRTLENPGFAPSSSYIKDVGRRMAAYMQQEFPSEVMDWPERKKWESSEDDDEGSHAPKD